MASLSQHNCHTSAAVATQVSFCFPTTDLLVAFNLASNLSWTFEVSMYSQGASRKSHNGDTLNHIGGVGQPRISLVEPMSASRISRPCSLLEFCWQNWFYENPPTEGLGSFRGDNYFMKILLRRASETLGVTTISRYQRKKSEDSMGVRASLIIKQSLVA